VCLCSSKSRSTLVSQKALVPVVHQLDSSQSEAVVGSSSDVASPSRSRRMSTSDIEDQSSPATSPEVEADSHEPVKRPPPRGLVDALSRYFTPSDKRRSRVSLNALPHASPRSLSSNPHSSTHANPRSLSSNSHNSTPAADTTHSDDSLPTMLPPTRRHLKKSALFARHRFWKRGSTSDPVPEKMTSVPSSRRKSDTGDFQPRSSESPTSELSPGACVPSESKPEVDHDPACLETCNKEVVKDRRSEDVVTTETSSVGGDLVKKSNKSKTRKRRTQLSSLQDSLSQFFSAEGERKRTPAQYVDCEYTLDAYQPFDYREKRVKWHELATPPRSESRCVTDPVSVMESSLAAASWPSTSYRLSNYHLAGRYTLCVFTITSNYSSIRQNIQR